VLNRPRASLESSSCSVRSCSHQNSSACSVFWTLPPTPRRTFYVQVFILQFGIATRLQEITFVGRSNSRRCATSALRAVVLPAASSELRSSRACGHGVHANALVPRASPDAPAAVAFEPRRAAILLPCSRRALRCL
jgi:hypothetical protein